MTTIGQSTLRFGSRGPAVTQLQAQLKKAGYFKGQPGDTFDASTRTAVQQFQKANGIKPSTSGTVGPKTRTALAQYTDGFEKPVKKSVELKPVARKADGVSTTAQQGLDRINSTRLHGGKDHSCTATTRGNLSNAGFTGLPTNGTSGDANNPRGMMSQMLQTGKWTSMNLPGSTEQTIKSPYGDVKANVLTGEQYADAAAKGLIPEGAVVFQANRKWNEANDQSRGSDVGIVRNGGIFNYKQWPKMTVYQHVAEVVVVLPNQ